MEGQGFVLTEAAKQLVSFANQTYAPFLQANVRAKAARKKTLQVSLLGGAYSHTQLPFGYQVKCLKKLQEQYSKLDSASLIKVGALVNPTDLGLDPQIEKSKL